MGSPGDTSGITAPTIREAQDRLITASCTGPPARPRVSLEASGRGQSAYEVHDEYVTQSAVDYINNKGITRRSGLDESPLCLSIGLMLPHQPFVARAADYDKYDGRVPMPNVPAEPIEDCHPYIQWWRERTGIVEVTDEEIMRSRIAYWALCDRTDQLIGEILDALDANGYMDNTIIIYTSDHGEQVGEHGLWWKQTFYEDAARVPAIVSWPGHLQAGKVIDTPIDQFDLAATMLEAGGAQPLPQSHGMSVIDLINDPDNVEWKDAVFSEYCMNDSSVGSGMSANLGGADVHARPGGGPKPHGAVRRLEVELLPRLRTATFQPSRRPPRTDKTERTGPKLQGYARRVDG